MDVHFMTNFVAGISWKTLGVNFLLFNVYIYMHEIRLW